MLDHVFAQFVDSLRRSFEDALLQRQAVEERFQVDVFLGDLSFETSYSLPGEDRPARIRADVSLDWPTWSQSAYRSLVIGDEVEELPEVLVEIAIRVQELRDLPDVDRLLGALPEELEVLGEPLSRSSPTLEQVLGSGDDGPAAAVEVFFEGSCPVDERIVEDPRRLDEALAPIGRTVASVLVRVADLPFVFGPADRPR